MTIQQESQPFNSDLELFTIEERKFIISKIKTIISKIKTMQEEPEPFNPDLELLTFADEFSKNYKLFSAGEYYSDNNKYHISYLDELINEKGLKVTTVARAYNKKYSQNDPKSEHIDLDRTICSSTESITQDAIFFIILWAFAVNQYAHDYSKTDIEVLKFYLNLGRAKKPAYEMMSFIFKHKDTVLNREREKEIFKFVNDFQEKSTHL